MKKWISSVAVVFFLTVLAQFTTAQAVDTERTINDPLKTWEITFSDSVKVSTVEENIYITDNAGKKIAVTLKAEDKKVKVTPTQSYQANETYQLQVTKYVTSNSGKSLTKNTAMPFTYKTASGAIVSVQTDYSTIVTNVIVKGHADVFSVVVTANGKDHELKYSQGNTYSLGILSLKQGDAITVKAYDADNKLLEIKQVNVQ